MNRIILIALVAIVTLQLNSFVAVKAGLDAEEIVIELSQPSGSIDSAKVFDLLKQLNNLIGEGQNEILIHFIENRLGTQPKVFIDYNEESEGKCESFLFMDNFQALLGKQRNALKDYLKQAYDKQEKVCLDSFEQRLRDKLAEMDLDSKDLALDLANYFSNKEEIFKDPYEFAEEHLFGGTVKVLERYLEAKQGAPLRGDIVDLSEQVFDMCDRIVMNFDGFEWILMHSKEKRPLDLNEEERKFLSVLKLCPYMPYNHFEDDIKSMLPALDTAQLNEMWAKGGYRNALNVLNKFAKSLPKISINSLDLYKELPLSEEEIGQGLQKYLKQTYSENLSTSSINKRASRNEAKNQELKGKHLSNSMGQLEHHCFRLNVYFGPYIYLIERLNIKSEGKSSSQLDKDVHEPLALTKLCRAIFSSTERKLKSEELLKSTEFWLNGEDKEKNVGDKIRDTMSKLFKMKKNNSN